MTEIRNNPLPPGVTIERATPADIDTFAEIHEEAARWLWDRGIHQWQPGELPRAWVESAIARGELYIVRHDGEPIGTVMLQWSDEETWGTVPDDAGYVHGLRIRRSAAGQGLGHALLRWVEQRALASGKSYLRLDCMAANPALRNYYEQAGFVFLGTIEDGETARYEKRLVGTQMTDQQWALETLHGALVIRHARPEDVTTLVTIEEEAARWVRSLGIEPGNAPRPLSEIFAESVARGDIYIATALRENVPAGKITLQTTDDPLWADVPGDALYVHGLTTARAFAGWEIGRALLLWAEDRAREGGKSYLRLDCNADNPALCTYYERAGFVHRGDVQLPHREASRYEQQIAEEPSWN